MNSSYDDPTGGGDKVPVAADKSVQASGMLDHSVKSSLFRAIRFQTFLLEFDKPEVRHAFLRGAFGVSHNTHEMLECIGKIRDVMLPASMSVADEGDAASRAGVDFFVKLMDGADEEPVDVQGQYLPIRKPFHWWLTYLGTARKATFWKEVNQCRVSLHRKPNVEDSGGVRTSGNEGIMHNRGECFVPLSQSSPVGNIAARTRMGYINIQSEIGRERDFGNEGGAASFAGQRGTGKKSDGQPLVEDGGRFHTYQPALKYRREPRGSKRHTHFMRGRSSSSGSGSPDSRESSSEEDRIPERAGGSEELLCKLLQSLKSPKDVVSPGKFDVGGGISMSRFLSEFEKYFHHRYSGSDRQCAQLLGDFLEGSAKQAYRAMDGALMKYSRLKPQLLDWYSSSRTTQRQSRELDFDSASRSPEESYAIYCLRLERLAARAYPGNEREQDRQLCRKFWNTAPRGFQRILADNERSLALVSDKKRLSWSMIRKLAEAEDRQSRQVIRRDFQEVGVAQGYYETEEEQATRRVEAMIAAQNKYYESRRPAVGQTSAKYHINSFNPTTHARAAQMQPSRATADEQPRSPPTAKRPGVPTMCHWCGRRGHLEEKCWEKLGVCIICGSDKHDKHKCPKFDAAWAGFKPVCSICHGEHLGRDCGSNPLN